MSRIIPDGLQWFTITFESHRTPDGESALGNVYLLMATSPEQALIRVGKIHHLANHNLTQPFTVELYSDQYTLNTIISQLPEQVMDYVKITEEGRISQAYYPTLDLYFHETMNWGMYLYTKQHLGSGVLGCKRKPHSIIVGTGFPTLDTWEWSISIDEWDDDLIREAMNTYISNRNN